MLDTIKKQINTTHLQVLTQQFSLAYRNHHSDSKVSADTYKSMTFYRSINVSFTLNKSSFKITD